MEENERQYLEGVLTVCQTMQVFYKGARRLSEVNIEDSDIL